MEVAWTRNRSDGKAQTGQKSRWWRCGATRDNNNQKPIPAEQEEMVQVIIYDICRVVVHTISYSSSIQQFTVQ